MPLSDVPYVLSQNLSRGSVGFFTEFQFVIRQDLYLTGNWTRLHQSYNDSYDSNQYLKKVMLSEIRVVTQQNSNSPTYM